MNANTTNALIGGNMRGQIPSQVLASTTETALVVNTDSGTPVTAILSVPSGNGIFGARNPLDINANASKLNRGSQFYGQPQGTSTPSHTPITFDGGRPFTIRIIGTGSAAANAGNTLTVKLYQGTNPVIGNDTLFSTPINALATASAANLRFQINVQCAWDSTSGTLTGVVGGYTMYNGTNTIITSATTTTLTGITSITSLGFIASITWGNAAGGTINISEMSLEQV